MTPLLQLGLIIIFFMIVPKIIKGIKEAIRFTGRVIGWGVGIIILYLILTSLL